MTSFLCFSPSSFSNFLCRYLQNQNKKPRKTRSQKFQQTKRERFEQYLEKTLERKKTFDFVETEKVFYFEKQNKKKSLSNAFAKRNKSKSTQSFPLRERNQTITSTSKTRHQLLTLNHNLYRLKMIFFQKDHNLYH